MTLDNTQIWWLLAGLLVAAELMTGTFYLLMVALGALAAALVAMFGGSGAHQVLVAGVVGLIAVAAWHKLRPRKAEQASATANSDVNLDIGQTVQVPHWQADGTAKVFYRGAEWAACAAAGSTPRAGAHRIVDIQNNQLILQAH